MWRLFRNIRCILPDDFDILCKNRCGEYLGISDVARAALKHYHSQNLPCDHFYEKMSACISLMHSYHLSHDAYPSPNVLCANTEFVHTVRDAVEKKMGAVQFMLWALIRLTQVIISNEYLSKLYGQKSYLHKREYRGGPN